MHVGNSPPIAYHDPSMRPPQQNPLIAGARVIVLGTLASRALGFVRDLATAALFGLSGVADALVIAFRVPNLFRQLFGEGALTARYLPVLSGLLEKDRRTAWQLASTMMVWLAVLLTGLVLIGEAILAGIWLLGSHAPGTGLLLGLSATLLPYMLVICLAAQVTATLQALGQFTVPALTPTVLNVCWLTGVWVIAPFWAPNHQAQAYVVAVSHPRGRRAPVGRATAGLVSPGLPLPIPLGGQPHGHGADRPHAHSHALQPGGHADQHLHRQPDRLGAGRRARRPATDSLARRGGALSAAARGGGGHLLRRADVPVSPGDRGHGRGRLDLSALEPARRPRPPRPPGGRPLAGAAAGAVPERAGRGGTDRAGTSGGADLPKRRASPRTTPPGWPT